MSKMKEIFLHKKIPIEYSVQDALDMRNLLWNELGIEGIRSNYSYGCGYVEVIAKPKNKKQKNKALEIARWHNFVVSEISLAVKCSRP